MYNQPFYIPGGYGNMMPLMMRNSFGGNMLARGNLFSKIASTFSNLKNYNWSGLINNTSKTLGIINQTIPLVRQVKPVMNNVRSMMKIASIFKDETDDVVVNNYKENKSNKNDDKANNFNSSYYDGAPTFFL